MAKKEERNLNVTIKSQSDNKEDIVVSAKGIFRKLKKYFLPWLIIAVMVAVMVTGMSAIKVIRYKPPLKALISFNYSGIEKGKDPAGRNFDVNMVKNSQVIAAALIKEDIDLEKASGIQQNITFEGIIPQDAMDRMTVYKSVYESSTNGNLAAAQAMLDVAFYPTQFRVSFNYANCGLSKNEAVQVFNDILDGFNDYFYEQYGYNKTLGTAVASVNYADYDYSEAIDIFRSTLSILSQYVKGLASNDINQFRSVKTGLTFNDLVQSINTISNIDLDRISSYVTVNNLTKDKASTIAYYQFRIDKLNRDKDALTERLGNLTNTIDNYQKDSILVMSGADGTNAELSANSGEYDKLIERKDSISAELAETKQNIKYYTQRKEGLEKATSSTPAMQEKVEADFESLNTKLTKLIEDTQHTAEEYYETVEFANAYNILVPPTKQSTDTLKTVIQTSKLRLIIFEALVFFIYCAVAFISSIKEENFGAAPAKASGKKSRRTDDDDDDEDDAEDIDAEELAEEIFDAEFDEDDEDKSAKPSSNQNRNKRKRK